MESGKLLFSDFVSTIAKICQSTASGCIFFTSDSNNSGRVAFKNGKISAVSYARKTGYDAVMLMPDIHDVRFRFDSNANFPADMNLPDTKAIIRTLSPESDLASKKTSKSDKKALATEHKQLIERALTEIIGPVAGFLCEEHLEHATSFEEAVRLLATEISAEEVAQLRRMIAKSLKG